MSAFFDPCYAARLPTSPAGSPVPSGGRTSALQSPSGENTLTADRYIPVRQAQSPDLFHASREASPADKATTSSGKTLHTLLLKNELLGAGLDRMEVDGRATASGRARTLLVFKTRPTATKKPATAFQRSIGRSAPFSLSPIGADSQSLLAIARTATVAAPTTPLMTFTAQSLEDDFYKSLLDWSAEDVLAVGLGAQVVVWSVSKCGAKPRVPITMLCDLRDSVEAGTTSDTAVASVKWMGRGSRIAVGTEAGTVQLWDAATQQRIRSLPGHRGKVGTLAWSGDVLASGGADGRIHLRDVRSPAPPLRPVLRGHTGEVCGLAWSPDRQHLASGCSGAKLVVWDATATRSLRQCIGHTAAVKAIAWSPHQRGLLASGGGLEDPVIRFWSTQTPTAPAPRAAVNAAAQVCNLAWSAHSNELVSTHGYAHTGPQNRIMLWRYPTMARPTTLRRGHTSRVLFMAVSPGGRTIVTGAGGSDETLLFWNAFSGPPHAQHRGALSPKASPLCLFSQIR